MKFWRRRTVTALLREALTGTEQDFTEGSLTRGIVLLGLPTMLELAMESTFGVVDSFWIAKLGANSMAASGLSESLLTLVFAVAIGLATAATATVARRVGEKDPEGASHAAVQAIILGVVAGLILGVLG